LIPDGQLLLPSAAKGPVTVAPPTPTPTPTPTPVPTPVPTPPPVFEVATPVPTPVPTTGQVLHETATRKIMRPFPTVRMRGGLTTLRAPLTLLSVRAPKAARLTFRCPGLGPTKRGSPAGRKKSRPRRPAFERSLRAGGVKTVSVPRHG